MPNEELEALSTEIKAHTDKGIEKVKTEAKAEAEAAIKVLKDALDAEKASSLEVKAEVVKLTEKIAGMKEEGIAPLTIKAAITKAFNDNAEAIKSIFKKNHGHVELVIKAVADITTGNANVPDGVPDIFAQQFAPAENVNLRSSVIESLVTRFATSLAAYPYTESVPKDGVALVVGEGVAKPQIDFSINTRFSQPTKVAAWERLTEEAAQDIVGLQSIAETYLRDRVRLKREKEILSLALSTASVYDAAATPFALGVKDPTLVDAINAIVTSIFTTHNYEDETPYVASLALVHPADFFLKIVAAKDENGLPLYPSASLFNRVTIGSVTIIPYEDSQLPVGTVMVGDMSKIRVADYMGYTVKIGWINDDFIKNQFVILGEERFHKFVKELDKIAFVKADIDDTITALTKA